MFHHFLISFNLINPHLPVLSNLLPISQSNPRELQCPHPTGAFLHHLHFCCVHTQFHTLLLVWQGSFCTVPLQSTLGSFAREETFIHFTPLLQIKLIMSLSLKLMLTSAICQSLPFFLHLEGLEEDISHSLISFPLLPRACIES